MEERLMKLSLCIHSWFVARCRDERGVVLAMALVVIALLMGIGSTALFSGYTNLLTSTNLRIATQARAMAEAGVNEALYRLSRQETDPAVIVPDLTNPNWQVEIDFTSADSNASDGTLSTIQASADWPEHIPDQPVILQFKKPDATGAPNQVLFYDRTQNPPFITIALPAAAIPDTAHPVIQIEATAFDDREAERRILAEATAATAFAPPTPLSSGVDVNLSGSGFIDGVNHDHRIQIAPDSGNDAIYGDVGGETTDAYPGGNSVPRDSPDDNSDDGNKHGVANTSLPGVPAYTSYPRLFNMQLSLTSTIPAWVGLSPGATTGTWTGTNIGYASAVALSNNGVGGPTVTNDPAPNNNVLTKGVFSWRINNGTTSLTATIPAAGTTTPNCSPGGGAPPTLVCRPAPLSHAPDSFDPNPHFPYFQEFLGLDDVSFQKLLDDPDSCGGNAISSCPSPIGSSKPPKGFTYVKMSSLADEFHTSNVDSPGTNEFGLFYVNGSLRINSNFTFKGLIYVDGSLTVAGSPTILGAIMVRGATQVTAGTGNMTLLYSRKAAELGIQAGHPWRILSWQDTEMQQ
jgi:hypothetical protein